MTNQDFAKFIEIFFCLDRYLKSGKEYNFNISESNKSVLTLFYEDINQLGESRIIGNNFSDFIRNQDNFFNKKDNREQYFIHYVLGYSGTLGTIIYFLFAILAPLANNPIPEEMQKFNDLLIRPTAANVSAIDQLQTIKDKYGDLVTPTELRIFNMLHDLLNKIVDNAENDEYFLQRDTQGNVTRSQFYLDYQETFNINAESLSFTNLTRRLSRGGGIKNRSTKKRKNKNNKTRKFFNNLSFIYD